MKIINLPPSAWQVMPTRAELILGMLIAILSFVRLSEPMLRFTFSALVIQIAAVVATFIAPQMEWRVW